MNLLPPSDNFYKFLAISGLILFIYMGFFVFGETESQKIRAKITLEYTTMCSKFSLLKDEIIYSDDSTSNSQLVTSIRRIPLDSIESENLKILVSKLPIQIKIKYNDLVVQKNDWRVKMQNLQIQESRERFAELMYIPILFLGELLGLLGLGLWFFKVQLPIDAEYEQKKLGDSFLSKHCNSCFKSFIFMDERGTEIDGKFSNSFCQECYKDGKYTNPELTYSEALINLEATLKSLNYSKFETRKKIKQFGGLSRWQRQFKW